jgi:hypothetical protein
MGTKVVRPTPRDHITPSDALRCRPALGRPGPPLGNPRPRHAPHWPAKRAKPLLHEMHWLGESHSLHDAGHALQAPVALLTYLPAGQELTHAPPASTRDPEHVVQVSRAVQAAQPVAQGEQSPSLSSKVPAGQFPAGAGIGGGPRALGEEGCGGG